MMKGTILGAYVKIILFVMILLNLESSVADPRSRTVQLICETHREHNATLFVPNFVAIMESISEQIRVSGFGVAINGSGLDANYGLAQCYGDLSSVDCVLCYAEARTVLPRCFPETGGTIFLDGCFMRSENYNFFNESTGPNDHAVCGNTTVNDYAFKNSIRRALSQIVSAAPVNNGFARAQVEVSGTGNLSVYALANCWRTLNSSSCSACLANASASLMGCLPSSEGRALNTGCFIRYSNTDFLNPVQGRRSSRGVVVAIVLATVGGAAVLAIGAVVGVYMWKQRMIQKKRKGPADAEKLFKALNESSLNFKYSTLEKATGSFHEANKLGQGGFGSVYKGVLPDGREIAVKRLFFSNKHRASDFYNEIKIISRVEHKNLVRLLGCSCSGPESLLVYEFLPNKSLDRFILDSSKGKALNWEKRYEIIIGTAEGLVYLHENCEARIIHRDIKASNILLDSRLRAKIADFGLARSFQEDKSHVSTAIAGTLGYMAPEYLAHGQLSEKADVYSFGVLVLEIVTGRQNNRSKASEYGESLISIIKIVILNSSTSIDEVVGIYTSNDAIHLGSQWKQPLCINYKVWRHFQQRTVEELFDPNLMLQNYHSNTKAEILRVIHVGLLCIQEAPSLRPSMSDALQMLAREEGRLPVPTSPPFMDEKTMELNDMYGNQSAPLQLWKADSIGSISQSTFYAR